jgi:hypothetical protein
LLGSDPLAELAIVGAEGGKVATVDLRIGRVGSWAALLPPHQDAWAGSTDRSKVYWSTFRLLRNHIVLAMDMSSLNVDWEDTTTALELRSHIGPITVSADRALSPSPDGTRLLVADAQQNSTTGIAVLDLSTRDPVAFIGPLAVAPAGMTCLRPTPMYTAGAVIVAGTRGGTAPWTGVLFVFDGATLALRDSATLVPPNALFRGGLGQVITAPDGVHIYVLGASAIYAYDLGARQVVASAPRLGNGDLAISPDGTRLYLSDAGTRIDYPGSGKIFVYDAALNQLPPIDLSAASVDGVVPVTHGLVTSPDGRRLYVTSGTISLGPLFGIQSGRVLVVDTGTGKIISTIALDQYGVGWILLR